MTPVGLVKVRLGRARGRVLARVLASAADVAMVGHWGRTDVSRASEATARASAWAWSPPCRPALTAPGACRSASTMMCTIRVYRRDRVLAHGRLAAAQHHVGAVEDDAVRAADGAQDVVIADIGALSPPD